MNAIVYTTTTCPYCNQLKNYLGEKNVSFVEKLVDQDEAAQKEMLAASEGFQGVPFTVFKNDDGSMDTVIGFDRGKIDSILLK